MTPDRDSCSIAARTLGATPSQPSQKHINDRCGSVWKYILVGNTCEENASKSDVVTAVDDGYALIAILHEAAPMC